ncbi:hypothetical protein [Streptosporangium sp. NPDC002524]|uniref:hypothetical protein n=1 Tax=Streptosporangium sp. NPDC002524 TaxID=3154537 RepID=UPI00331C78CC
MSRFNLRIFVFDELFSADQSLRGHARVVREAATDLTVPAGGLPPEAQAALNGLAALRGRLEHAADAMVAAAGSFGQTGAAARKADTPGVLAGFGRSLKENVVPPGEYGPLGPYTWMFGRLTFLQGALDKMLRHRYGYPHAKDGRPWRVNGSGPRLHPRLRTWADRAAKAGKVAGPLGLYANSLNNRLRNGASVPRETAGAAGEAATVFACATVGAKAGAAVPIPHPAAKVGLAIGGGLVGGAACSRPGKWVGDRVADGADKVADGASKVGGFVKDVLPKPPRIGFP